LSGPNRPHNSLYVVSDQGAVVERYDKRFLSHTEVRFLYTPGTRPVVFEVDGFRFGTVLCIEVDSRSCSRSTSAWTWTACWPR
jgi:predicted amidohydrolase